MSILLDETTRVCVQGVTGTAGRRFTESMRAYGTCVVAGVSTQGGSTGGDSVPIFSTVRDAVAATGPDLSVVFVGGRHVLEAVYEAVDAGIGTVVVMAEYVPVWDALRAAAYCRLHGSRLIGPNTNGLITMERAVIGFFPSELSRRGPVGIVSRSGTLAYGAMASLQVLDIGQSTVVGIGGSAVPGTTFVDCLELFAKDDQTAVVVMLGEIGGTGEEATADYLSPGYPKPVLALLAGSTAPLGVTVGHAGAIVAAGRGSWKGKRDALAASGVEVVLTLDDLATATASRLTSIG